MRSLLKTLLAIIILIGNFSILNAQDTIIKRDNEKIICKIKEISTTEIKYLLLNNGNEILLGIDKNDVSQVRLSNGTVMNFTNSMYGAENYKDQNKNLIKVRLFSPLWGFTEISYERSIRPGRSLEISAGIIGAGINTDTDPNGMCFKLGYKFIQNPDFYVMGMRYAHVLKGFYLRPEIAVSIYRKNDTYFLGFGDKGRKDNVAMAILFNVGKQWIFDDFLALDLYFGLGYGFSDNDDFNMHYGFTTLSNDAPLAITTGFRLGVLF
jgi:hypothetical protein